MQIFRVKKASCKILKTKKNVFHLRCNTTVIVFVALRIFLSEKGDSLHEILLGKY